MTYVIGGLNGSLDSFNTLEKAAGITDDDTVYVLGGVIGGDLSLLTELSMRANVYAVAGKSELDAAKLLGGFARLLAGGGSPDPAFIADMQRWAADGGAEVLDAFRAMDADMREGVIEYLEELALFEEAKVGTDRYLLLSAGIDGYRPGDDLYDIEPGSFVGEGFDIKSETVEGYAVITAKARHADSDRITTSGNNVCLDCGRAVCLRLDDSAEFYV